MHQNDGAMTGQVKYDRIEGDFYPTPPENVTCLAHFYNLKGYSIWEPACGEGHISKHLESIAESVMSSDLYMRGYGQYGIDFINHPDNVRVVELNSINAIITNPPFGDEAEAFIRQAHKLMKPVGGFVAMFLRNEYDCATKRNDLFGGCEYYAGKVVVQKRPRWIEGSKGSPRHNYSWYIWDFSEPQTPTINYIHPKHAVAL